MPVEQPSEDVAEARYFGKYPAVVEDNTAGDSERGHTGNITVRIFGMPEEEGEDALVPMRAVARPCLPPGFFFVPEKGAHVWVEFAMGLLDHPIWVGVWYPDRKPFETSDGQGAGVSRSVIATPGGHEIVFDDDGGTITIRTADGIVMKLDRDSLSIEDRGQVAIGDYVDDNLASLKNAISAAGVGSMDGGATFKSALISSWMPKETGSKPPRGVL
ncbi:MAG: phage baseplate assembly protein V [Myxococcales bacterium]|nr:phage baseplate assembly protein V [Myxococcales bacterium]